MSALPPSVNAVTLMTLGIQGPPGINVAFAGITPVTFAQSGLALLSGGFYPVDTLNGFPMGGGNVVLNAPAGVDGALFGVSDLFGNSTSNPIIINAVGIGVTIGDPSNPGVFTASVHIAATGAVTAWWAFLQSISKWVPVWW
jgi:hypothetical protein